MVSYLKKLLLTTLLRFVVEIPLTGAASAEQWLRRSIYQVVTDRFATSDLSGPPCDTTQRKYCNGTWAGITQKLDYIQSMGFDAVWISPIVHNIDNETTEGEAYHGYWSQDVTTLNPHFGDETSLIALSNALHSRNMFLLLDVVINHMAASSLPTPVTAYTPFNVASDFHAFCFITDFNNQTDVEQCSLGDNNVALVDLNTESQAVVDFWYSWISQTVQKYHVDGVRIDTAKHIRKDFWTNFTSNAGVWTVAEILDSRTSYVGDYTKFVDSVLDYPTYFALTAAFKSPNGNLSSVADVLQQTNSYENGGMATALFLENHDQPRFGSLTPDEALIKNAMTTPFMADGVPILYYGQEQGYSGGGDPNNREALWTSGYATQNKPFMAHITKLNQARKAAINSSSNFLTTPLKVLNSNPNSISISKMPLLTLLTNVGTNSTSTWGVSGAYPANSKIVDVLTCNTMTTDGNGGFTATTNDGQPKVFLPVPVASSAGICNGNQTSSNNHPSSASSIRTGFADNAALLLAMLALASCLSIIT